MEAMVKESSLCGPTAFQWLGHTDDEAASRIWKLSDCFSAFDADKKKEDFMENRKPALELKDVPPPPQCAGSKPFPSAPLPRAPPCFQPLPQEPVLQKQQQQTGSPKVSVCTHCEAGTPVRYGAEGARLGRRLGCGLVGDGGGGGGGGVSFHVPKPPEAPNGTITCQVGPALRPPLPSGGDAYARLHGYELRLPPAAAAAASSQPLAAHQHLPCCAGLLGQLHSLPAASTSFSRARLLPAGPSAPVHQDCLATAGYYPCGVDFSPGGRGDQRFGPRAHLSSAAHLCTNHLHLNVDRTVCLKGTHYCRECLRKPSRALAVEAGKAWPNIPPPPAQSAPVPIPVCNGCGVPGATADGLLLLGASLGASSQKYGSPESGGQENLPPIGVFWDIENCSVPSGRSAMAVVQRIRHRFFQGHREAEFMCVCDISKENKEVIQELNNCQVTVAHINATAKNAADDKLRQSLRRFADTHTAPATVVLVSSDVNFASELSDLRHRHGFQVILVHKNQASEALLQHAHRHVAFEEFVSDLPPRMPVKTQELCKMETKPKMNYQLEKKSRNDTPSPQSNGEVTYHSSTACKSVSMGESSYRSRRKDSLTPRSVSDSPVEKAERGVGEFQVSTPSAFSKLNLQRTLSPLVLSQGSWSSRSGSPSLSNRSSPLAATLNHSPCPDVPQDPFSNGVDIQVANVDYRMSRKELQQILRNTFSKHGRVKSVELSPHTDYQLRATVQMSTLQEAISAVSGLHRYKIGGKRIHVSLVTGTNNKSLAVLSSEIISILQDAPACCLPLFKFTEIYEKKFGHKLAVCDLYKLTDVVAVRDQGSGRLVCLLPSSQARQSPLGSSQSHDGSSSGSPVVFEELEYHEPICRRHYTDPGFSEADFDPDTYKIPFVVLSIKAFAAQVHSLLQTHEGTVPLLSFPECYASEFSPLELSEEGEAEGCVPLEHLITCIPGINIVTSQNGIKVIKWIHNKPPPPNADPWVQRCKSPVGNPQLIQFSREVIDLMKSQPCCLMPVSKFIPSYHHHFAKQCRVSDYGYSKLLELLEAVPHVLQILGMGSKRLLTLTHRAQVKRFTQDLLRLLKFQVSKQVVIQDFMQAYHWCFSRDWNVTEYGACELMDLLAEIPDTTISVTQQDSDLVISIPKRERTPEEIERTKQFAKEVVDLLRHQPRCRMPFNKFIPSYHHHFGRQCKLTYYGFTKLMELFEAIPDVLVVLECGEEKILTLTEVERLKALAAQFVKLLRSQKDNSLPVSDLLTEYSKTFGYGLKLQDFDVGSVLTLLQKLCHVVKVVDTPSGREVQLINRKSLRSLTTQLLVLLMSLPDGQDSLWTEELSQQYEAAHGVALNPCEYGFVSLGELLKSLPYLVELFESEEGEERVRLTRLYQFGRSVRALLHTYHYQQIFLTEFPSAFSKYTGKGLQPRSYGYSTVEELLGAIPQVVWIKGHGHKKIIVLKNDMKVRTSPVPLPVESSQPDSEEQPQCHSRRDSTHSGPVSPGTVSTEAELLCLSSGSPVDLLCGPVPSCLPSPQLHPDPVPLGHTDLIQFEEQPPQHTERRTDKNVKTAPDTATHEPSDPVVLCSFSPPPPPAGVAQVPGAEGTNLVHRPQQPSCHKAPLTDSPGRRASRNKVKLAANFSFSPVTRL
ncbi:meiosis regulator and mRNA stability factor 1 isoform X3 [Lepisosteus oculatus]|uniref:meiosis regulator and mRNA stability factor 1 isoform X3 n=1 Tax=Lepisosteus oculatus TaxID=7918 RepID=UPI0035F50A53